MKNLTIESCDRDLRALDAAEQLQAIFRSEIEKVKEIDTSALIKKASVMLFSGNISLDALGLPSNLFEQYEKFELLNSVARKKLRDRIHAEREELLSVTVVESTHE